MLWCHMTNCGLKCVAKYFVTPQFESILKVITATGSVKKRTIPRPRVDVPKMGRYVFDRVYILVGLEEYADADDRSYDQLNLG